MATARKGLLRAKIFISIARVFASCFGALLGNFLWLAAFLTFAERPPGGPVSWVLWLLAPVLTALGFSVGVLLFDQYALKIKNSLRSVLPFPLVGCVLGTSAAFLIGPMFIGIGMLALGGLAVCVREVLLHRHQQPRSGQ